MTKIALTINKTIEEEGRERTVSIKSSIPISIDEMTFRSWVDFHLLLEAWQDWLKEFAALPAPRQVEARQDWTPAQSAEYWIEILKIIANFAEGATFEDLLDLRLYAQEGKADFDNVEMLSRAIFSAITQYKPKERSEFIHKGVRFVVPGKEVVKIAQYTQTTFAPKATAGEIIEALQRAHIFGANLPDGKPAIPDKRYHTDLAAVASVCRVVDKKGKVEEVPLGQASFADFVTKRMAFLADLPADVAIDVSFFLLSSVNRSLITGLQNWRLQKEARRPRRRRRQKGKRG